MYLVFHPRTLPRISLQYFALNSRCCKAKNCRNVLGQNKIEGTPMLKLAMVKRLKVKKFIQKFDKKFVKKNSSKNCQKIRQIMCQKIHRYQSDKKA